jgi:phosphate transport system substrate-binding protein
MLLCNRIIHRTVVSLTTLALALMACDRGGETTPAQASSPSEPLPPPLPQPARITVAGSTAMLPLLEEAARKYRERFPNVTIRLEGGGSRRGLQQVASGDIDLAASDVIPIGAQLSGLVDHKIGGVGIGLMSASGPHSEAVQNISQAQVRRIFSGQVRSWRALGGGNQPLRVIHRDAESGMRFAFATLALGTDRISARFTEYPSASAVRDALIETPGTFAYLPFSYRDERLKVFEYEGAALTEENLVARRYPLWVYLHVYSRGPARPEPQQFLSFLLEPSIQNEVLPRLGYMSLSTVQRML